MIKLDTKMKKKPKAVLEQSARICIINHNKRQTFNQMQLYRAYYKSLCLYHFLVKQRVFWFIFLYFKLYLTTSSLNSSCMQSNKFNRFQNLLTNKRQVQFSNRRKHFQLDRIIQQYQSDLKQLSPKKPPEIKDNNAVFSLNKSIKISPLRTEQPKKKRKKHLELQTLQPYKSNQQLASHLRLRTLSTRYKSNSNEQKLGSRSIEIQPKSTRRNKQILQSIKAVAKNRHSSLITLQQRRGDSLVHTKQRQEKTIKWSHRSRKGYNPHFPHKPNQDEYLIKVFKNTNRYLFAIADGHGQNGHLVSQLIIHRLQSLMAQETSDNHILSLSRTYNKLQDQLYKTNLFDVSFSGSTLLTAIINYPKLICANAGDSRAVLARKLDKQNWEIVHISEDHKPSLPKQRKRILKKGGKIYSFKDEQGFGVGPLRVWLPSKNMPGLAMSRSLGDNLCKSIGVTHEPQVVELQIDPQDKFVILGSDGVWQNVTSSQILNFLVPLYNQGKLQQCCDTLMHLCLSSSIRNPAQPIDDITFIIVFLNKPN